MTSFFLLQKSFSQLFLLPKRLGPPPQGGGVGGNGGRELGGGGRGEGEGGEAIQVHTIYPFSFYNISYILYIPYIPYSYTHWLVQVAEPVSL